MSGNFKKSLTPTGSVPNTLNDPDPHHTGLVLITMAFVVLLMYVLSGFDLKAPPAFFILYGLGGLTLMSYMHSAKDLPIIAGMEFVGAAISLFIGTKLYVSQLTNK
mgnify:CR=1 FL=1